MPRLLLRPGGVAHVPRQLYALLREKSRRDVVLVVSDGVDRVNDQGHRPRQRRGKDHNRHDCFYQRETSSFRVHHDGQAVRSISPDAFTTRRHWLSSVLGVLSFSVTAGIVFSFILPS